MEMEFENTIYDASPWTGQLEMIFSSAFGMTPPAAMQLELANQLRALMSELAVAPAQEASSEFGWLFCRTPDSVSVFLEDQMIAAQLGPDGSVATIEMGNGDLGAWSIQWDTPMEGMLGTDLFGSFMGDAPPTSSRPRPAVRIGIFQGEQRISETAFDHAGGWEDELDDQALIDDTQSRLEEACSAVNLPEEDEGVGMGTSLPGGSSSIPSGGTGQTVPTGGGTGDLGGTIFKGAAVLAGMAAAGTLAAKAMKGKGEPSAPASEAPATEPKAPPRPVAPVQAPPKTTAQQEPQKRICTSCGKALSPRAKFCPGCGTTVPEPKPEAPLQSKERPKFCSSCGTPTQEGDRFCRSCGQQL